MFAQDSSRKLGISNGSHFITHLRKCQPLKNVLIINNCNLALRFQINFCKFDSIGGLKLTDCVSHQLCQLAIITENLGVNIFSSSQPLYMLPIPNCGEIIQPIKTYFWLSTTKWKHILWMKWWLILKISYLWGLFLASIKCKMNISAAIFFIFFKILIFPVFRGVGKSAENDPWLRIPVCHTLYLKNCRSYHQDIWYPGVK